jgi:hypothetical protein
MQPHPPSFLPPSLPPLPLPPSLEQERLEQEASFKARASSQPATKLVRGPRQRAPNSWQLTLASAAAADVHVRGVTGGLSR